MNRRNWRAREPQPHELTTFKTCEVCGETKAWAEFSPARRDRDGMVAAVKRMCRRCDAAREAARRREAHEEREPRNGQPRTPHPREWVLTKRCPQCGETKAWAFFSPSMYWPDGSVRRVKSWCRKCAAADNRTRFRPRSPERIVYRREWQRRRAAQRRAEASGLYNRLPVGPLREWLTEFFEREEETPFEFAARCGIQDRSIRRILREHEHVSLDLADKILVANGVLLSELYPLEEAA